GWGPLGFAWVVVPYSWALDMRQPRIGWVSDGRKTCLSRALTRGQSLVAHSGRHPLSAPARRRAQNSEGTSVSKSLPGTPPVLAGYSYVRPLGVGGFADVFQFEQNQPRRSVAVKVLLQS